MNQLKAKPGNLRVTGKEQYYTPNEVALEILDRVIRTADISSQLPFLEPAGGTGAFIEAAKSRGFDRIISFDIDPKHPQVDYQDFLEAQVNVAKAVCVTNPPFGRNNALSVPFFNRAAQHCDLIAFVVPRSWRKWSVINRLDRRFTLLDDFDLNIDYVNEQGVPVHGFGNLRTCVQMWRKVAGFERNLIQVVDHQVVEKTTPELADISMTQFGYGCGSIQVDFVRKPNTTKLFLKLKRPDALDILQSLDYSRFYKHTAYTEALSMREINFLINEKLGLADFDYSNEPSSPHYLGLNRPKS